MKRENQSNDDDGSQNGESNNGSNNGGSGGGGGGNQGGRNKRFRGNDENVRLLIPSRVSRILFCIQYERFPSREESLKAFAAF